MDAATESTPRSSPKARCRGSGEYHSMWVVWPTLFLYWGQDSGRHGTSFIWLSSTFCYPVLTRGCACADTQIWAWHEGVETFWNTGRTRGSRKTKLRICVHDSMYLFLVMGQYSKWTLQPQSTRIPTLHRWHASEICQGTFTRTDVVFRKDQCPGIDPPHANSFPVILTLLSIPFSVLFNLPRLSGLTSNHFRRDLANMALEIVSLWAWDPMPVVETPKTSIKRSQAPMPIFYPSRNATFENMRPQPSSAAIPASYAAVASGVLQAESGEYIIGTPHVYFCDGALTMVPLDHDVNREKEMIWDTHVSATSSLHGSTLHQFGSMETQTALSDTGSNSSDQLESKLDVSLQAHVAAWLEDVGKETLDPVRDCKCPEAKSIIKLGTLSPQLSNYIHTW